MGILITTTYLHVQTQLLYFLLTICNALPTLPIHNLHVTEAQFLELFSLIDN